MYLKMFATCSFFESRSCSELKELPKELLEIFEVWYLEGGGLLEDFHFDRRVHGMLCVCACLLKVLQLYGYLPQTYMTSVFYPSKILQSKLVLNEH